MGDKEALERLKACAENLADNAANLRADTMDNEPNADIYIKVAAQQEQWSKDLTTLIAEREGLEREVERLTKLAKVQTDFALLAVQAREAAESKLSALSEVVEPLKNAFWALGYLVDDPRVQRVLDADERLDAMTRRNFAASALRAILHPTVPVENNT